jgi:CPA1 family monovalent cation:H+ antiporter
VAFWDVVADFAFAVSVAIAIGLAVGALTVFVRSRLRDPVLDTAISFAVPFVAYIPAEFINASGVLAVVVAGLYSGHQGARRFTAQARISERLNWRTLQFVLENGVFLLMGIQVSALITQTREADLSTLQAVGLGLLMMVVVLAIRFAFMGPLLASLRRSAARAERQQGRLAEILERFRSRLAQHDLDPGHPLVQRQQRAEQTYRRRQADVDQLRREGLGWRGGVILGWSGMRGVVTLAAAQSLPPETPYRAQLVLIAFTVAVATLLVQGGTLPWVIRLTGIRGSDATADRRELAALLDEIAAAGLETLAAPSLQLPDGERVDQAIIDRVRAETLSAGESAREAAEHGVEPAGLPGSPQRQYRMLRREVLQAERDALLAARAEGRYTSRAVRRAQAMIDLEETRLEALDSAGGS